MMKTIIKFFIATKDLTEWLTYYNPNSKLHIQFAKSIACTGVKEFDNLDEALNLFDSIVTEGFKNLVVVEVQFVTDGIFGKRIVKGV